MLMLCERFEYKEVKKTLDDHGGKKKEGSNGGMTIVTQAEVLSHFRSKDLEKLRSQ
jgi:hypothetical protein